MGLLSGTERVLWIDSASQRMESNGLGDQILCPASLARDVPVFCCGEQLLPAHFFGLVPSLPAGAADERLMLTGVACSLLSGM